MNAKQLKQLKALIHEAIQEAGVGGNVMILNPGTPEWDELQKALASLGRPPRHEPMPYSKPKPSEESPKSEERPVFQSKHPVMMFSPEEMIVLRKAAAIMKTKEIK